MRLINKEVLLGRVVGLFLKLLFINFRLLFVGLVLKKDGLFRLIYYLLYLQGFSVNDFIDQLFSFVKYILFDEVFKMLVSLGQGVLVFCLDIKSVFWLLFVYILDFSLFGYKV